MNSRWLDWARRIEAIAQLGRTYTKDPYDRERYDQLSTIAAEIVSQEARVLEREVLAAFALDTGPATPKIDVRGAAFKDDRILLVRERSDGLWTLPGGWAEVQESASEAADREVREESGFTVRSRKLVAVLDRDRHEHPPILWHTYKLIFLCDIVAGEAHASIETDAVDFFSMSQLPPLSTSRITKRQIERIFEHARDPSRPTDFD